MTRQTEYLITVKIIRLCIRTLEKHKNTKSAVVQLQRLKTRIELEALKQRI